MLSFGDMTIDAGYTTIKGRLGVAGTLSVSAQSMQVGESLSSPASTASSRATCWSPRNVLVVGTRVSIGSQRQIVVMQEGNLVCMIMLNVTEV